MDNYTHNGVIYTLLERYADNLVRVHTAAVFHNGTIDTHIMTITRGTWDAAINGNIDERCAIDVARDGLIRDGII